MEGSEPINADDWQIAELEAQLVAMARNGEHDTIQFEKLQDQIEALKEIQANEPHRLG